ncbi:hypothetical protein D3C87_1253350 [compost metagenome]
MGTDQVQRRGLAMRWWKQLHQPPRLQIVNEVQPRFVDQAFPGDGPAAHRIGIVADAVARDRHGTLAAGQGKTPAFMDLFAPYITKTVVAPQVVGLGRCSVPFDVCR